MPGNRPPREPNQVVVQMGEKVTISFFVPGKGKRKVELEYDRHMQDMSTVTTGARIESKKGESVLRYYNVTLAWWDPAPIANGSPVTVFSKEDISK